MGLNAGSAAPRRRLAGRPRGALGLSKLHTRLWTLVRRHAHVLSALLLIAALVVFYWFRTVFVVIHPGESGVLYRLLEGGTVTDRVFGEGLHFVAPWNRMSVYNVRIQTLKQDFTVLTRQGLPIDLTLAMRYRPTRELLGVLHAEVGPNYAERILVPQVQSVLRKRIGALDPATVYTNEGGVLRQIALQAAEEASQRFVEVDEVIIRTVALPDAIKRAVTAKLVEQQRELTYAFTLARAVAEATRKAIEAEGVRDYQANVRKTLTPELLRWQAVERTVELATSPSAEIVILGGHSGLPVILGHGARPHVADAGIQPGVTEAKP